MSAQVILQSLFNYKASVNEEILAELAKIDPDTHQSERHAAIRLLNHIYVVDRIFAAHLSGQRQSYTATNTPETPSFEALRFGMTESDRWYVEYVREISPENLREMLTFTFTDGSPGSMSREEMLAHVATHGDYHRGALGRILPQLSVGPLTVYLHTADPRRRKHSL
jgi:uncharacterized damage-inducible protein DinB